MWLGHKKLPLAKKLHNKVLYADATTQKADYLTAFAAIVGILGVGIGFWWADAAAALFISISVIKDGIENLKNAVADLMDRRPMGIESKNPDPLVSEIKEMVASWQWVEATQVRFREHGQVYFGEVFIIAKPLTDSNKEIPRAVKEIKDYHWKIHDVVISIVPTFGDY
jgi:divalent metal cation (Fe/Co/Zn/Cd) transporter